MNIYKKIAVQKIQSFTPFSPKVSKNGFPLNLIKIKI